ncbi:hypothetical protein C8R43DRAFT_1115914 [Mycena crocata]|nr:hypothetical protein C8R43DRAFT_1115914 [Mycena crocata]
MASRPKRKASTARPGKVVINAKQKRRNQEQIEAEALAEEEAETTRLQEEEDLHRSGVQRVAAKEDEIREQDEQAQIHAARPDLVTAQRHREEQATQEQNEDLADNSVHEDIQTGPSGDDLRYDSEDSNGGGDKDTDYIQPGAGNKPSDSGDDAESSDDDSDQAMAESMALYRAEKAKKKKSGKKKAQKVKPKKGELRAEIMQSRQVDAEEPLVNATKRKTAPEGEESQPPKRPKAMVGGLKRGWKKDLAQDLAPMSSSSRGRSGGDSSGPVTASRASSTASAHRASSTTSAHRTTISSEPDTGAFDDDEPPEALQAARKAKVGQPPVKTAKMGIVLTTKEIKLNVNGKVKAEPKPRYVNADLPFDPPANPADLKVWQTDVLSIILDWAGSIPNPFSATSHPHFNGVVEDAWSDHFPGYQITDTVYSVAASGVRNGRSEIGKRGLDVAGRHLKTNFTTVETRRTEAQKQLREFSFLYREPETQGGVYRSDFIFDVMEAHYRVSNRTKVSYGHPVGALSLAAAALERGFAIWSEGIPAVEGIERRGKKSALSFIISPWAGKAAAYLPRIQLLGENQWHQIWTESSASVAGDTSLLGALGDGGATDTSSDAPYIDPRSTVPISDDEI